MGYNKKKKTYKATKLPNIKIKEWCEYFKNLLNPDWNTVKTQNQKGNQAQNEEEISENIEIDELDKEITQIEVNQAIDKLKSGKAAGIDDISPDLIKLAKPKISSYLTKLFNKIYNNCYYPLEWTTSIIIPLHKKGSKLLTDNYRGISLLSVTSKIFTAIINKRLYEWIEKNMKICEEQAGFRRHFSTIDHIFTLYSMVNNKLYGNKRGKLYVVFIDYKKAFDRVNREVLWDILKEQKVSTKMINIIKAIYNTVKATVRFGNKLSEIIDCPLGVKQGCLLSPLLFSILINKVAQKVAQGGRSGYQFIAGGKEIYSLLFADDIVLISETPSGLQNQINNLKSISEELGLEVNLTKTKCLVFRKGGYLGKTEKWYYGQEKIETVNSYKYLGYTFTTKLSTEVALSEFAGRAKGKIISIFKALYKIGRIDISIFFHLFDAQIKPMMLYAAEIWGNTDKKAIEIIEKVHMFAARKLLGVSTKTPKHLIYGELNRYPMIIDSKIKTIKYWLKLQELDDNRIPKQAYIRDEKEQNHENSWSQEVKKTLETNGFGYIWLNKGTTMKPSFLKSFKQRLTDQFWQKWSEKINENDRFNVYKEIKKNHNREKYLRHITITKFRKIYTKIRFGISDINTHKAQYDNSISLKCKLCGHEKEDELHVLLYCPSYAGIREKYINKHWKNTNRLQLADLIDSEEEEINKDIASFLFYALKRREYTLNA